ncbi:hypothetical protein ACKI2N_024725 [Cupriavidus sp. 30B13]|uniref:recombination directionality factor n=1 Tax=Cupriavidus sp. 30B13 TaxID=3384241 RepID=UPI003B8FD41F
MLKGLAITPPVIGRISIGHIVEKDGERLPEKDDQFTLTSQIQNRDGWILHPLDETLRKAANGKLRAIPVRVLFNDPALNLRADYCLFDRQTGRQLCVGNGESCRRVSDEGMVSLPCPSPAACQTGREGGCKPYGRLNVVIGDEDELGSFIFRTTSYNSIRTLTARLSYFHAVSGGLLACLPLELRLRGKSTALSHQVPIYYVDLTIRSGLTLERAITEAREVDMRRRSAGFEQAALDSTAQRELARGMLEENEEEAPALISEFFLQPFHEKAAPLGQRRKPSTLKDRLDDKIVRESSEQMPQIEARPSASW